jgi:hypothetical protein
MSDMENPFFALEGFGQDDRVPLIPAQAGILGRNLGG